MAPANERATFKLSLLAETADEYIKLECNRRRHQQTLRKRLSFVEQFSVYAPKSRLKERQAQAKHHEFLLLPENKAPLDAIVDHVRDLTELPPAGRQAIPLSPMEQSQLRNWADDVHKLLYAFTSSSSHYRDPIVALLEKLQFLQDSHMCLVEVAADARTLLERWNQSGVFDSSSSDEEGGGLDEDDNEDGAAADDDSSRTRRNCGPEHTYAYQTVRQRAAANVIKRNVMCWARSQQAFCDRVEELRLFGKTTQSLVEELMSRKRSPSMPTNDIFAMVKVRRGNLYSQSINFKDLMLYAKHVALFPVDQALRSVEELDHKRFLFETRCAIKLQTVWRKTKKILQSKRMLKMVQEVKLKHEQEEQARQQHLLELKARKAAEAAMNKHKAVAKSPKKGGRGSLVSPPPSSSPTKPPSSKSSEHPGSTPPSPLGRVRSPEAALSREEAQSRHGFTPTDQGSDSAAQSDRATSSRKHNRSADGTEKDSDDDGDTRDVEQAWQSFLDSATTAEVDIPEDSEALMMAMRSLTEPQDEGTAVATLSQVIDDDWRNWSDGEEGGYIDSDADSDVEGQRKPKRTATPKSRSKPSSRVSTSGAVTEGRLVTPRAVEKSAVPDAPSNNEENSPRHTVSRRGVRRIGDLLKPSIPVDAKGPDVVMRGGVAFKSNQTRVSKMVPFADVGAVEDPAPVRKVPIQASTRKHLYDLDSPRKQLQLSDLGSEWTNKAALLQLFSPLVEDAGILQPEEDLSVERLVSPQVPEQSRSMRTTTVIKAVKMEKLKAALMQQEEKLYRYPDRKQEAADETQASTTHSPLKTDSSEQSDANETTAAPHLYAGIAIHRGIVMRSKGRAEVAVRVAPDPNEPATSASSATVPSASPSKKLKLGSHAEWLRSIGIAKAPSKTPQPPRRPESSSTQELHRHSVQKAHRRDTKSVGQTNEDTRSEARAPSTVLPALSGYHREKGRTFIKQTQPGTEMELQTLLPSVVRKVSNQIPVPAQQRRPTRRSIRRSLIQSTPEAVHEPVLSTAATVATFDAAAEEGLVDEDEVSEASELSEQPESDSSGVSEPEECGSEEALPSDGSRRASKRRSMQLIGEDQDHINEDTGEQQVRYDDTTNPRASHGSGAPMAPEAARRKLRHRRKRHQPPSPSPTARASLSGGSDITGALIQPEHHVTGHPASLSPYLNHSQVDSRAPPVPSDHSQAAGYRSSSVVPPKNQAAFHRLLRQYLGLLQCDGSSVPMSVPNTIS